MLKIKEIKSKFLNKVQIGRKVFCLELDPYGYEGKIDEVAKEASSFNMILVSGNDVMNQSKELADFCKQVYKLNPMSNILIETKGEKKPVGMTSLKNTSFVFYSDFINNKDEFHNIEDKIIKWFSAADTAFVFKIADDGVLDDIDMIAKSFNIKNKSIYIHIQTDDFKTTAFKVFNMGFNIYVEFEGEWFDKS